MIRILLVEDSPSDAKLLATEIRRAGLEAHIERVDEAGAMQLALARSWDLIISDWSMPTFSALAALAITKQLALDIPFIIVSGMIGEESAVEAMRAGAKDYLLKDRLARLPPVIEREIREAKLRAAHRASEQARQASEARFSRLAESGIIGIVIGTPQGTIVEANDAFLDMIGYTREDLAQSQISLTDLTAPEFRAITARGFEQLRLEGHTSPYEKEYIRKDGTRIPVLIGVATLSGNQSIAFMVDLGAQKRAEVALERSEDQLRQAQKLEAVGRLAGGVAHDFNNLLSVILSYCELILMDADSGDRLRADVEEIERAGQRASDLTRQLLTFSRQDVVEPRVVELRQVLVNMEKMLRRILGEDIELVTICCDDVGRIRIDPSHIDQVVMNLVVNSRDAMPRGGTLTIEIKNTVLDDARANDQLGVAPGRYVEFVVTDTGAGIDRETRAKIFEPFFTTKDRGKGTGLGLSTVFGIVRQCSGAISVDSEPGAGTTFKVYFPRVELAAETVEDADHELEKRGGDETILLAEDDDQIRSVAIVILRALGYRVLEARDAREAMLQAETYDGTIDLLVTDVVMPKMSGPELAKRLLCVRPSTRILLMSGYTDDALGSYGALVMEPGVAYLQKPITPDKLARKVRAVLDR